MWVSIPNFSGYEISDQGEVRRIKRAKGTQCKGVSAEPRGKWRAAIRHLGTRRYIGVYNTEEEAARAYDAAAIELCGEFAYVNFPIGNA